MGADGLEDRVRYAVERVQVRDFSRQADYRHAVMRRLRVTGSGLFDADLRDEVIRQTCSEWKQYQRQWEADELFGDVARIELEQAAVMVDLVTLRERLNAACASSLVELELHDLQQARGIVELVITLARGAGVEIE